jgi:hypothetical protein
VTVYFAQLASSATFSTVSHLTAATFKTMAIEGVEGETTTAVITDVRPSGGLLAGNRFAHIAVSLEDGTVHHLFAGKRLGAPRGLEGPFARLEYDCRTGDLETNIAAALDPLLVAPGYDALFHGQGSSQDPLEVLDGYHADLYMERRTAAVSVSDSLFGRLTTTASIVASTGSKNFNLEASAYLSSGCRVRISSRADVETYVAGVLQTRSSAACTLVADTVGGSTAAFTDGFLSLDFQATDLEGEAITYDLAHEPITAVQAFITARFVQAAQGEIDLQERIQNAAGGPNIRTLSFAEEFADNWPSEGESLGGDSGYLVKVSRLEKQEPTAYASPVVVNIGVFKNFAINTYKPYLTVGFDYEQRRTETATFTLSGNAQAVPGATSRIERLIVDLQSVPSDGTSDSSFFNTARGRQAVEHALHVAAAMLAEGQRCVAVRAKVNGWPLNALYVDTDKTVSIASPRLPGGWAIGKVARYALSVDDQGRALEMELRCSVGGGYTAASTAATGYADPAYADHYAAESSAGGTGGAGGIPSIGYVNYASQRPTSGVPNIANMLPADFVQSIEITNQWEEQLAFLTDHQFGSTGAYTDGTTPSAPEASLRLVPTDVAFTLQELSATGDLAYTITVTPTAAFGRPATIDLTST